MATAFMGFPSSAQSGGSAREGHTPYHRGRGAGCASPKTTATARGHYSKTAPTSIGTLRIALRVRHTFSDMAASAKVARGARRDYARRVVIRGL